MVFVGDRFSIEKSLRESPKAFALFCYLDNQPIQKPTTDFSESDKTYYSLLKALAKNSSSDFRTAYDDLSKRKVLKEQPIIYDNYLLFLLIVGVLKYQLSAEWLKALISLRDTINEPERIITISFSNILNRNHLTTEGVPSITLAGMIKYDESYLNPSILKNSLGANKTICKYLQRDLFLACIYLFTTDYIISTSIGEDSLQLKKFETTFLNRVLLLQDILYVLILAAITFLWFYLIASFPNIKEWANDVGLLLQLLGIGLLAFGLNKIKSKFGNGLKRFFGYKKLTKFVKDPLAPDSTELAR